MRLARSIDAISLVLMICLTASAITNSCFAAGEEKLKGKLVYYASGKMESMVMDMATGQAKGLGFRASHPALSPDCRTIAYIDDRERLHVYRLDSGTDQIFAAEKVSYSSPTFVSGDLLAFLREDRSGKQIYTSPVSRFEEKPWLGKTVEMGASPTITGIPGCGGQVPCLLLVSSKRNSSGLYLLSADQPRCLLPLKEEGGDNYRYPSVSPDGKTIAFVRDIPEGIWLMNIDGSGLHQIQKGGSWPAWSPDGKYIAYLGTVAASRGLKVVDSRTGNEVGRTAGAFLQGVGLMRPDGTELGPVVDAEGKSINTRGDNVAWQ